MRTCAIHKAPSTHPYARFLCLFVSVLCSNASTVACANCSIGSWGETADTVCNDCPGNSSTLLVGSDGVDDCLCNLGFYGNITIQDVSNCTVCAPGTVAGSVGLPVCPPCEQGRFSNGSTIVCSECAAGSMTAHHGDFNMDGNWSGGNVDAVFALTGATICAACYTPPMAATLDVQQAEACWPSASNPTQAAIDDCAAIISSSASAAVSPEFSTPAVFHSARALVYPQGSV